MIYHKFLAAVGLIIIFSITAINCQTENKHIAEKKEGYLTAWVKINEENLYLDLMKYVNRDSTNIPGNEGLQKTFTTEDTSSYLGKFTKLVRKSSDSIEVRYIYTITNKVDSPGLKILLTVNYNKKYAKALDSVLNSSIQTKHFMVEKYEQPASLPDIYRFQNGDIWAKNIRIEIINDHKAFAGELFRSHIIKINLREHNPSFLSPGDFKVNKWITVEPLLFNADAYNFFKIA